jgi:hypothetical protein
MIQPSIPQTFRVRYRQQALGMVVENEYVSNSLESLVSYFAKPVNAYMDILEVEALEGEL